MRSAIRNKSVRGQVSSTYSIPAPIKGWNARDSIAAMAPGYANVITNFWPTTADVMLRLGQANHVTGITGEVQSLLVYRPATGSHKMFGFAGTALYDVSSAGAVGAAVVTGLTNAQWQSTNVTTGGGAFSIAVNGVDKPLYYNGATWVSLDAVSTPAITGVTSTSLINVNVFKSRVWYVQKATLDVWYTAAGAITGALTKFSLGSIFKNGGYLVAMGSWTLDSGTGVDDLAVFITSEGEVAVYQGTDPASASTWALVGVFNIGSPIGYRCLEKFQGDLLMITQDGLGLASKLLTNARASSSVNTSAVIVGALARATELYAANFGWEVTLFPTANMLLLNVPIATGQQEQYVMNTTTGAWARFTNYLASCFEVFNDELYFGTTGKVVKGWTGTSDNGALIVGEIVGAFDYFGARNGLKQVKMVRPVIGWDSNPAEFLISLDADFIVQDPTGAISFTTTTAGVWDTGRWDSAVWGGDVIYNRNWYSAFALGYAFAPHLKVSSLSAEVRLAAFDFVFERGGVL